MKDTREALLEILKELHPEISFTSGEAPATGEVLDSFDMASLVAGIRAKLDVAVPADQILPEHFETLDAICALVDALRG